MQAGQGLHRLRMAASAGLAALVLAGCATRPINPRITEASVEQGYTFQTRQKHFKSQENLVILAFSGGGTRAAAFSYGVLEFLRRTEAVGPQGNKVRLLDAVDMITGVSGGSFTALAYGLYGDKLFADYEQRFLKRDVQGELIGRALSPAYWGDLSSPTWGRSELAAQLYDEILFNGATFADLDRGEGPFIVASATDIASGSRLPFNQNVFNVLCADLNAMPLSRAAAASSAVPVVLSPVTINNYGGTCNYSPPPWAKEIKESANPPRPASRAIRELKDIEPYEDSALRPYIHLVDGGVSDNVAMRGVLDALELLEALHDAGRPTPARSRAKDHHLHRQFAFDTAHDLG
jgi:NTE family protein